MNSADLRPVRRRHHSRRDDGGRDAARVLDHLPRQWLGLHLIPLRLARVMKTAIGAWLGFFAIGLVLWGIYTGKFSPTEAAGVTVGFCYDRRAASRCRSIGMMGSPDQHAADR